MVTETEFCDAGIECNIPVTALDFNNNEISLGNRRLVGALNPLSCSCARRVHWSHIRLQVVFDFSQPGLLESESTAIKNCEALWKKSGWLISSARRETEWGFTTVVTPMSSKLGGPVTVTLIKVCSVVECSILTFPLVLDAVPREIHDKQRDALCIQHDEQVQVLDSEGLHREGVRHLP
jgi:hypothetical protein